MLHFSFSKSVDNLFNRLKTDEGQAWLRKRCLPYILSGKFQTGSQVACFRGVGKQYGNEIAVLLGATEYRRSSFYGRLLNSQVTDSSVLSVFKVKKDKVKGKPFFIEL